MSIKTKSELEGMKRISHIVGLTLKKMRSFTKPGMSTKQIDEYGYAILKEHGASPAPMKTYGFPGYTCISVNHEVCHGIPSAKKVIREGDLVNIDVSAELNGFYSDNGGSFIVGEDRQRLRPLVQASQEILHLAIRKIKHNVRIYEVGGLINREAKRRGFQVIKNLCGHGVGRHLHEAPEEIPNFKDRLIRGKFKKNMVVALETFISTNAKYAYPTDDQWTMLTKDQSFVAQHEHTLVVTDGHPIVLTKINGI